MSNLRNPFKIEDRGDGPWQVGRMAGEGLTTFSGGDLNTFILIADKDSRQDHGDPVLVLKGVVWKPEPGATIHVPEPNREVTVVAHRFEVVNGQFSSMVFVRDPETARP